MVSRLLIFIFSGNANCVTLTGQYHAQRFGDRFFAFNLKTPGLMQAGFCSQKAESSSY